MVLQIVLAASSLVATLLVVVLVLRQPKGGQDVAVHAQFERRLEDISVTVQRLDEQMRSFAQFQSERIVELQTVVDARLQGIENKASDDTAKRLLADSSARTELQTMLGDRLQKMEVKLGELDKGVSSGLNNLRTTNATELEKIRGEVADRLQKNLKASLQENSAKISELKTAMGVELEKVRTNNEAQLEKMRETVDEKLQGTLEKRLGESFKLVSERLEQVQRGLGEMQTLASDVGGLKRVLSNVKSRGTWGEVLLSRQLEDVMAPGQFEENVAILKDSGERVEFAVRLPGRDDDAPIYLPIDSKFPQEPYERLLVAQEDGDPKVVADSIRDLEKALRLQAQTISEKYIHPPFSTDFAIMYVPTEGLFAEAIRIPGFAADMQRKYRVMITGPTTLLSLLNSLQMGFRTLAIEKRSSEVWQVLAAAKAEFQKYGQVWEKLGKQLKTAQNTVEEAGRRTRAVERQLRDVEDLEIESGSTVDALPVVSESIFVADQD